ncbi:hypothetical protein HanPSC8_Chr13g0560151 [Helianthus annuus]|nr:hypothetical protein HanPSC8_Chr13g0560151 [Helianthus annuus]
MDEAKKTEVLSSSGTSSTFAWGSCYASQRFYFSIPMWLFTL